MVRGGSHSYSMLLTSPPLQASKWLVSTDSSIVSTTQSKTIIQRSVKKALHLRSLVNPHPKKPVRQTGWRKSDVPSRSLAKTPRGSPQRCWGDLPLEARRKGPCQCWSWSTQTWTKQEVGDGWRTSLRTEPLGLRSQKRVPNQETGGASESNHPRKRSVRTRAPTSSPPEALARELGVFGAANETKPGVFHRARWAFEDGTRSSCFEVFGLPILKDTLNWQWDVKRLSLALLGAKVNRPSFTGGWLIGWLLGWRSLTFDIVQLGTRKNPRSSEDSGVSSEHGMAWNGQSHFNRSSHWKRVTSAQRCCTTFSEECGSAPLSWKILSEPTPQVQGVKDVRYIFQHSL